MESAEILAPLIAMFVLTFVVWLHMYVLRLNFIFSNKINSEKLKTPEVGGRLLPDQVNYPAYNFKNLFELPVVFYALCLLLYVTQAVDSTFVAAAWVFVAFRILHSLVHCTFNKIVLRFGLYMVSALALWFMLGRVVLAYLT